MRLRWFVSLALLASCYQPAAREGAPCGPNGECPESLSCQVSRCLPPGSLVVDSGAVLDDTAPDDPTPQVDAGLTDAGVALGPWGMPVELALSVGGESDPSMTRDRLTIVFMSENDNDLYIATRATPTGALTATKLTALSSNDVDKSPEISEDGKTIYFVSDRDGDYDVYRSTFSTAWSPPARVDELSSSGDDSDLAVSPDLLTAVVVDNRATNRFLLHTRATTEQPFGPGVHRPELSVASDAEAPTITNGGAVIYFHAGLQRDVYVATRKSDGTYTAPVAVAELNTLGREAAPFVLQDDRHMLFERGGDLYETSR